MDDSSLSYSHLDADVNPSKRIPAWQAVLRWIVFFPGAIAAALMASFALRMVNHIGMNWFYGLSPESMRSKVWDEVFSNALMGAAFVYGGSKIAPSSRKIVAYSLALFLVLLAGFFAFPAVADRDWWAVIGLIASSIGAAILAHSVAVGELDLDQKQEF